MNIISSYFKLHFSLEIISRINIFYEIPMLIIELDNLNDS